MSKLLWTQKQDIGPKPRVLQALAYDSKLGRTILFGGDSLAGHLFADTWSWDGSNWTQVADMGPRPRSQHAMAYDAERDCVVLFGGDTGAGLAGDTWEWSNDAWTQVGDTGPSPRSGHAIAYDSTRGRVVLFGGSPGNAPWKSDTWEWDGSDWVQVEDSGPSPRRSHAMTYDSARARIVLFGGCDDARNALGDTWEYDASASAWTQVGDTGPDACFNSAMVFKTSRCELFGGVSGVTGGASVTVFDVSWEWDGAHWTARQDIGPGGRTGHAMAYDSARDRVVIFGGSSTPLDSPNPAVAVVGDTWEQFETGGSPPPQAGGGPSTSGVALASFDITPQSVSSSVTNVVVFQVQLVGPAGNVGQLVELSEGGSPMTSISIPVGAISGQVSLTLTPGIAPGTYPIDATSGGVTISAGLTIT